ncbi:DUF4870 domain-containing protein [Ammoniphilus sp. 3BR4]|uniref:DUF4870 domain-containing protein n=1 Tax=Ammoniphilus sp. 3BR4 TaxID=3158265 RepID=UPI0034654C49
MSDESREKTSIGLEANVAGFLCYLFGVISGVIILLLEKENKFVKFHALQSVLIFAVLFILNFILGFIPIIGWIGNLILIPVSLILWILMMVKAYKGEWYALPIIGEVAAKQAEAEEQVAK